MSGSARGGAVVLVTIGLICQEVGASIAVLLFPAAGLWAWSRCGCSSPR
ncbi:hypothetical protein KAE78_06710 [Microbacterium sp. NIBRBAC000506063]|nr:hypothetical protein [Microbacterium sp. NIBRBAC000506063]QTV80547.1 hypothetical protein KAE78_06710 [Microbacterium sp. NIBRBAC000506063]